MARLHATTVMVLILLVFAEWASAECAWVLWTRVTHDQRYMDWASGGRIFPTYSKCWTVIHQETGVAEEGSWADWYAWIRRRGRYRGDAEGAARINVIPGSVIVSAEKFYSEWRCLPETMDPRGPKVS